MKTLEELRAEIDRINAQLVELLAKRFAAAEQIAQYKKANNMPVHAPQREKQVIENVKALAKKSGLDEKAAEEIFKKIIEQTKNMENEKVKK